MEINKFGEIIVGVIPTADVVEGRFGLLTTQSFSADFGSQTDLPGFKVPATAEEAKIARYLITWPVDNHAYPRVSNYPRYDWALRQGFDKTQTFPMTTAKVYLVNPAHQEDLTIPSGTPSLAYGPGTYTLTSSDYIAAAGLHSVGALIQVANTAEDTTDAGKAKLISTYTDRVVGQVREYDSVTGKLTVDVIDL